MGTHFKGTTTEVRALDAYIKLMRASGSVASRLERRLLGLGLTENQFGVLETLFHLGPMYQREIGQKLFVSGANITMLIDNLEKRSLVRRQRSTSDRRYIAVHLTDEGRALIESIFPDHVTAIVELFSALSSGEQETLGALCKKLGKSAERGK
jgi:MarR family transcriptional regulator, 2-MHQ and catechol-resistance regulon repressor